MSDFDAEEWRANYARERADRFAAHVAKQGTDWGPDGHWAFLRETDVRNALAASDERIARALQKDPASVRSSYSPAGVVQAWTAPKWTSVLVGTECGIGDPYQYAHVFEAFNRTIEALNANPWYWEFEWSWDSINAGVHCFYLRVKV